MASHDQLTRVPGRTLLRERVGEAIERATQHGRKAAVFVIDLDHFKRLNIRWDIALATRFWWNGRTPAGVIATVRHVGTYGRRRSSSLVMPQLGQRCDVGTLRAEACGFLFAAPERIGEMENAT